MYKQVKHRTTGKQTGMPILYYRANQFRIGNDAGDWDDPGWSTNTYDLGDSLCDGFGPVAYGVVAVPGRTPHFNGEVVEYAANFYNAIENPNFPGPPARPYRSESFILHSAGPDGLYGTVDDVFNFDSET